MNIRRTSLELVKTLILFLIFIGISCSTNKIIQISNTEIETNFNKSLKQWKIQKKAHNNSYEYQVSYLSWVGYRNTTKLVVRNGKLVSREFSETQQDENDRFTDNEILIFKEDESNINKNQKGFKAVLLDELYDDCGAQSLQANEKENKLFFTVDDMGIMSSCGYTPKDCVDDCSIGVYISSFKWLE